MLSTLQEHKREVAIALGVCVAGFALWKLLGREECCAAGAPPAAAPRKKVSESEASRANTHSFNELTFIPTKEFVAAAQPLLRDSRQSAELDREDLLRLYRATRELMAFDCEKLLEQTRLGLRKFLSDYAEYEKEFIAFEQALEKLRTDALAYVCHYTGISLDSLTRRKIELTRADPALAAELKKLCDAKLRGPAGPAPTPSTADLLKLYESKGNVLRELLGKRQKERHFLSREAFEQHVSDVVAAHCGIAEGEVDPHSSLSKDPRVLALRNTADALMLELQIKNN